MAFQKVNPNALKAVIDFQGACMGNLAFDLSRLITVCTDRDVRLQLEESILQFYYDRLTVCMESEGKHLAFSLEQLTKAYRLGQMVTLHL